MRFITATPTVWKFKWMIGTCTPKWLKSTDFGLVEIAYDNIEGMALSPRKYVYLKTKTLFPVPDMIERIRFGGGVNISYVVDSLSYPYDLIRSLNAACPDGEPTLMYVSRLCCRLVAGVDTTLLVHLSSFTYHPLIKLHSINNENCR